MFYSHTTTPCSDIPLKTFIKYFNLLRLAVLQEIQNPAKNKTARNTGGYSNIFFFFFFFFLGEKKKKFIKN
jgi:hypothetical protein